ncbi:SRPBCC family protein [Paenibacillus agricola]|uniref:SRPBCC domain-containing protein n=1 Tax=Paenibacillus agricola TaxID=2716264 RepID=A0ABX0J982_9BACL|nr:SRPBCC domain-containing protein [Paenibacillus agricola]NHN30566.1 SRPBCC domain-containing protein [Paenibacillus agricola]
MEDKLQSALPDIVQTLVMKAPIQKVWNAVATSEGIAAWFMPNDFQPVAGHEFEIDAGPFGMSPCQVIAIDPPHSLSFKWAKDWTISFTLVELGEQTELTLVHAGWDANTVNEFGLSHTMIRDNMAQGWVGLGKTLVAYVEA